MRAGIVVNVTWADRRRLEAIVSDRCAPQKHVWRAQIILATADGCGTAEIMRRSGKAKPVVWTWQARFMAEGVDGLLRDKTRKPGKAPLPAETVQLVIDLVTGPPPGEATHWTGRMLAKVAGVSLRSVQRILEAHQLAPHRIRTFKLSNDPKFAAISVCLTYSLTYFFSLLFDVRLGTHLAGVRISGSALRAATSENGCSAS